jgi:hypothetical protein
VSQRGSCLALVNEASVKDAQSVRERQTCAELPQT